MDEKNAPLNEMLSDPRSVSELIKIALDADEDDAWHAISALHWRGSREVVDRALDLCASEEPRVRICGVDILGQIGIPERNFPVECWSGIESLLEDQHSGVLAAAIVAAYHMKWELAAPYVLKFQNHLSVDVRHAVASTIGVADTPEAIAALVSLMKDADNDVRNWATFGLAQQSEIDSVDVRNALTVNLEDDDEDVRYEAVYGLARRRDARALPYLIPMVIDDPDDSLAVEFALEFLGLDSGEELSAQELIGALERRKRFTAR